MTKLFASEQALIDSVVARLEEAGVEAYEGVPCMSRCIDLLVVGECLSAIEFKMGDWKKALTQAKDHLLSVDRAYVCLPERKVTPEMKEAFAANHVGLILHSGKETGRWPFTEVVPAPESGNKWTVAEKWLADYLQGRRQQVLGL